jgi:hypothetical protein
MAKAEAKKEQSCVVMTLRVEITDDGDKVLDNLETMKEIVEQARGYASVHGVITINGTKIGEVT